MSEPMAAAPQLIICVLNEPAFLDEVLAALLEADVITATVIESQGMGRLLSQDMPIFASFRHMFTGSKPYNYTIVAPVRDFAITQEVIALLRDVLADAPPEDRGFVLSLPLSSFADLGET